ncbi:hypothetical protein [Achromobacter insolitus]|uniref:hypothetical protein n=1 Tax=Achromobacter insolitus TaxID=217204 RepID=UPI0007C5CBF1|nr:hypothetical protein [Achromobacter insolitus]
MKTVKQFVLGTQKRREQNRAINAMVWTVFCGEQKWVCTFWLCVRFVIYLLVGVFAGLGFILSLAPGPSLDALALPFFVLWHRAPTLYMLIALGAIAGCGYYVYARAAYGMAKAALTAGGAAAAINGE